MASSITTRPFNVHQALVPNQFVGAGKYSSRITKKKDAIALPQNGRGAVSPAFGALLEKWHLQYGNLAGSHDHDQKPFKKQKFKEIQSSTSISTPRRESVKTEAPAKVFRAFKEPSIAETGSLMEFDELDELLDLDLDAERSLIEEDKAKSIFDSNGIQKDRGVHCKRYDKPLHPPRSGAMRDKEFSRQPGGGNDNSKDSKDDNPEKGSSARVSGGNGGGDEPDKPPERPNYMTLAQEERIGELMWEVSNGWGDLGLVEDEEVCGGPGVWYCCRGSCGYYLSTLYPSCMSCEHKRCTECATEACRTNQEDSVGS